MNDLCIKDIIGEKLPVTEVYHLCISKEVCGFVIKAWTNKGISILGCKDSEHEIQEDYESIKSFVENSVNEPVDFP